MTTTSSSMRATIDRKTRGNGTGKQQTGDTRRNKQPLCSKKRVNPSFLTLNKQQRQINTSFMFVLCSALFTARSTARLCCTCTFEVEKVEIVVVYCWPYARVACDAHPQGIESARSVPPPRSFDVTARRKNEGPRLLARGGRERLNFLLPVLLSNRGVVVCGPRPVRAFTSAAVGSVPFLHGLSRSAWFCLALLRLAYYYSSSAAPPPASSSCFVS